MRSLVLVIAALGLLAACSTQSQSSEVRSSGPPSAQPSGAEVITNPLDVSGVTACSLLDAASLSLAYLDNAAGEDTSNENASACTWRSSDNADSLHLAISSNFSIERVDAALTVASGSGRLTVRGYPAAREGPLDSSICTIYTAVSDVHLFSVEFASRTVRQDTPCAVAEGVAAKVVDALAARSR